jgi:HEAT repeat protein
MVVLGEAMARIDREKREQFELVKNRYEKGCEYSEGKPEPAMHFGMAIYGSDESVQSIVNWMNTEKPEMRYFCAEKLGFMGNRKSDGALCMILEYDKDVKLRRIAATALGRRRSKEGRESVIYALDDRLKLETAQALGMIGDPASVAPLKEHLKDPDPAVRLNVAFALARLGDKSGVDEAKAQLGSKEPLVAAKAAATLIAAGDAAGTEKLKEAWGQLDARQRYWFILDNLAGDKWALPVLKDLAANDKYPGIKRFAAEKQS